MIPFEFQREKTGRSPGGCEDALPVANEAYSVVCDGLGGAGMTKHTVLEDGAESLSERTSAYLGARIVSECVNSYYNRHHDELATIMSVRDRGERVKVLLEELKSEINDAFQLYMEKWQIEPSLGKTKKTFPTTLASAMYFPQEDKLTVLTVWAGDSRVYALSPQKGLQLLSMDDAVNAENEMNSASEMTNTISAGNSFRLNYAIYEMDEPGIVFCCSDGCFDYRPSPLHVEWLILKTVLEYMPAAEGKDLGVAFAESMRDTIYPAPVGDDTTMAGIIFGIDSDKAMKELYQKRMAEFDGLAIGMNEALNELKGSQDERDASQKTCRLLEGKIASLVHDAFCVTMKAKLESTDTHSSLLCAPWELACVQKKEEMEKLLDEECDAETEKIKVQAEDTRDACRDMLVLDYIKWQREQETAKGKGLGKSGPTFATTLAAKNTIMAWVELYRHRDFSKVVSIKSIPEDEIGKYIQSQVARLEELLKTMKEANPLFEELWGQAYYSTENFAKERNRIKEDAKFNDFFKRVLKNPKEFPPISELTTNKIREYHKQCDKVNEIKEKFVKEKENRLDGILEECWNAHQKDFLKSFISEDETTLRLRFESTTFPMDRLMDYVNAQKSLTQIDDKIKDAQNRVEQIWTEYKAEYQLIRKIDEKGVC